MDDMRFEWLKQDLDNFKKDVKEDFAGVNGKLDTLLEFKWKIVGGTVLASLILTVIFNIAQIYYQSKGG